MVVVVVCGVGEERCAIWPYGWLSSKKKQIEVGRRLLAGSRRGGGGWEEMKGRGLACCGVWFDAGAGGVSGKATFRRVDRGTLGDEKSTRVGLLGMCHEDQTRVDLCKKGHVITNTMTPLLT